MNDNKKEQNKDISIFDDALSISQTTCINGIFVILIFMSHFCQYADVESVGLFKPYLLIRIILGQLVVAPFLFYSGYGIMEQITKKETAYVNRIPIKRIFKTWLHFFLAIVLYLLVSFLKKMKYSGMQIILSFVAWESIGNSNWYIFVIILMYFSTYISFKLFSNKKASILSMILLCVFFILLLQNLKEGRWWYDTMFCFPFGIIVSYYKRTINDFVSKKRLLITVLMLAVTTILLFYRSRLIIHELLAVIFCFDIVLLCTFVRIINPILDFFGRHAFEIYILQRIPMILFCDIIKDVVLFFSVSALVTIVIAVYFKKILRKVDLAINL